MIGIYNGTQHEINIYSIEDTTAIEDGRKLILKEGAVPLVVVPSGKNLNCVKSNSNAPSSFEVIGLPASAIKGAVNFTSYDPLPEEAVGKVVIVSNLYRSAVKELGGDTSRFATVDGVVYLSAEDKRPCGCLGLAIG
jgi:hypothetical protein